MGKHLGIRRTGENQSTKRKGMELDNLEHGEGTGNPKNKEMELGV